MSLTIHKVALLVVGLVSTAYGRFARTSYEKEQGGSGETDGEKLAAPLLAMHPAAAFNIFSSAAHSAKSVPSSLRNLRLQAPFFEHVGKHHGHGLRSPAAGMVMDSSSVAVDAKTNDHKIAAFMRLLRRKTADVKWIERVNRVSNFASILCAIDCTVFPLLLTLLPIINAASSGTAAAWLHKASHACALWFVGPVGGLAVTSNLLQHKRPLVGLWGYSGIAIILLANIHLPHVIMGWHVPHAIDQFLHAKHEIINVFGCALLLSSQRFAHSLTCCSHGDCGHDHGNAKSSDHSCDHSIAKSSDHSCCDHSHEHSHDDGPRI